MSAPADCPLELSTPFLEFGEGSGHGSWIQVCQGFDIHHDTDSTGNLLRCSPTLADSRGSRFKAKPQAPAWFHAEAMLLPLLCSYKLSETTVGMRTKPYGRKTAATRKRVAKHYSIDAHTDFRQHMFKLLKMSCLYAPPPAEEISCPGDLGSCSYLRLGGDVGLRGGFGAFGCSTKGPAMQRFFMSDSESSLQGLHGLLLLLTSSLALSPQPPSESQNWEKRV